MYKAILERIGRRTCATFIVAAMGGVLADNALAQSSPVPGYSSRDVSVVAGNLGMVILPCEIGAPDFVAAHAPVFDNYRRRHAAAIAHLEKQREYVVMVNRMKTPQGIQEARATASVFCVDKIIPALVRFGRAPDSRFFTPTGSWNVLKAAFGTASRTEALLVISGDNETMIDRIRSASDQELRMAAAQMGELAIKTSSPEQVLAIHKAPDGRQNEVTFSSLFGEWYVTGGVGIPWAK
jgi:hypothetical protein